MVYPKLSFVNHRSEFYQAMYTGIVEQMGNIDALVDSADGRRLQISFANPMADLKLGDSINISGCCFTIIDLAENSFTVQASQETLRRTKLGKLKISEKVNLERPVKLEDRLGGHLVSGHIDGLATVIAIQQEGFSKRITFTLPLHYAPFFVEKGSVTIDGVSLTVCETKIAGEDFQFDVALIPYTMEITTLGNLKIGEAVNIETDLIAKYLARWISLGSQINMAKISELLQANAQESMQTANEITNKEQVCN